MATQNVQDPFVLVQTAGDFYNGNSEDQTYYLIPDLMGAGDSIKIIDTGGRNTIALPAGLEIVSSVATSTELLLTLSNGSSVNVRGANNFTFSLAPSLTPLETGNEVNFNTFLNDVLSISSLNTSGATTGGSATVQEDGSVITTPPVTDTVQDDHGDSSADASTFVTSPLAISSINGDIEESGDSDWFEISLSSGTDYQFTVTGNSTFGTALADPVLSLYDANGTWLATNDDTNGLDPLINFSGTSFTGGTYYLEVEGFDTNTGGYTLSSSGSSTSQPAPDTGFNYSITYSNISDFGGYASIIDNQLKAALDYWGQFIIADNNASIELIINAQSSGGLASARSLNLINTGESHLGYDVFETNVQTEIRDGVDPNGADFDAEINITVPYLADFWYDPTPLDRQDNTTPFDQYDFMGILLHEFGHALGFTSAYSYPVEGSLLNERGFITQWDSFLNWNTSQTDFYFTGSNATSAYSALGGFGNIPVYSAPNQPGSSLSHYGGFGAEAGLLQNFLMNPGVTNGTLLDIAALDLAILEDLGYTVATSALNNLEPTTSNLELIGSSGTNEEYMLI